MGAEQRPCQQSPGNSVNRSTFAAWDPGDQFPTGCRCRDTAGPHQPPRRPARAAVPAGVRGAAQHRVGGGLGDRDLAVLPGDRTLASSLTVFLADNPLFADLAARAGFGSLTTVAGYLASLFALLAVPLGLFAAGRVADGSADEEARRLTVVFAAPVTRRRWFLVEAGTAVAGTVVLATGAGVAAWAGAATVGAEIAPAAAVGGALNVLPVAWLSLGAALLAYGGYLRPPLSSVRSPPSAASSCRCSPKVCAGPPGC